MRIILSIVLFIHFNLLFCQECFNGENLFRLEKNSVFRAHDFVSEAVFLEINANMLVDIFRSDAENIKFSIPISEKEVAEMTLDRFKVFSDDFLIRTSAGDTIHDFQKAIFLRGRITNFDGFATICISENEFMGIISIKNRGDFNIGNIKDTRKSYIIYNDDLVKVEMGHECHAESAEKIDRNLNRVKKENIQLRVNCVKFYLEGDYALYQNKGSVTNTANYMAGLFSQMATLYSNENINIEIKEIKIWVSADGYSTTNSYTALTQFMDNNPNMNADLAHLFALGGSGTGGIAWVDALCVPGYNFAYSNISANYNNVPTYSWSVEVITHETGHNLGSSHTHACVWNGDNTQIDDCGNKYYYDNGTPLVDIEGYPCYDPDNPILPVSGTVMSYCHLLSGIGINFNNGFGIQPGDLIRSNVNTYPCLNNCTSSPTCYIPVNVETGSITSSEALLDWEIGQGGSKWQIQYGISGFTIGSGTIISNITTTSYTLTGLVCGSSYDWYIRTDCSGGSYSSWVGKKTFSVPVALGIKPEISGNAKNSFNEIIVSIPDYFSNNNLILQSQNSALDWYNIDNVEVKPGLLNYIIKDEKPNRISFYRIKVTDYDGIESFSNIISIIRNEKSNDVIIYPNPANKEIYVQFEPQINGLIDIGIYNLLGYKVYFDSISSMQSGFKHKINVENLKNGIYLLDVINGTEIISKKLLIVK